jgi:hypothetical protein
MSLAPLSDASSNARAAVIPKRLANFPHRVDCDQLAADAQLPVLLAVLQFPGQALELVEQGAG